MKILSATQIKALDKYTIETEPVASIDLMERAAGKFVDAISEKVNASDKIVVFCGMGNNGGDGLAVARMLIERGYLFVNTYVLRHSKTGSSDFLVTEERLKVISTIQHIETANQLPVLDKYVVVVDAMFGSGLSRPVEGIIAVVIQAINQSGATVYSIDVPSGLFCDKPNLPNDPIVHSTITYTFHSPKLSFLFAANGEYVPEFDVLDIGLNSKFAEGSGSPYYFTTHQFVQSIFRKREKFSHKGTYGHALIAAGSYGKMGAAVLSVKAALRSGAGLVSSHIPACGYDIMQISNPEAMVSTDKGDELLTELPELKSISAIGVGPGIGTSKKTASFLKDLLNSDKPLVLDADALNIMAEDKTLLKIIPVNSILTPHPGEFKRLAGEWKDDLDKITKQIEFSKIHKVVVVLKGANTSISTPEGLVYFNSTGNPGMAKGGSGDVLTGILTALLAQGYTAAHAAIIGVYIHGLAGDIAKSELGETGIKAGDIVYYLPRAFKQFE